jgi:uncharacterized protein (DUF1501 family)
MTSTPPTGVSARDDGILRSLHPDCPDWQTLGPTTRDATVRAAAARAKEDAEQRTAAWSKGFNRRTFLKGGLGVGVAALGAQLVTSRVSYASAAEPSTGTLVVIFLRGGMDGLSLLVPVEDPYLLAHRAGVMARSSVKNPLIAMNRGFALHPSMKPLQGLIDANKVAVVPAVSTPDLSRSHFQAQDCLERGSSNSLTSGWLDRVLEVAGTGTTFRSVSVGGTLPRSLMGESTSLAMYNLESFRLDAWNDADEAANSAALSALYTGLDHPIASQTQLALSALSTVKDIRDAPPSSVPPTYPKNSNFADALESLAQLIKANVGVRVACVDVGGWDTHTGMGTVDSGDMKKQLDELAISLKAFTDDIGDNLNSTTIVTMSEFGRRVEQNSSGGTDHGHGGAVLVIGGGVSGGVKGRWDGLSEANLASEWGDIPGWNDYRTVLSEVVTKRLNISDGAMSTVFPNRPADAPVGVMV